MSRARRPVLLVTALVTAGLGLVLDVQVLGRAGAATWVPDALVGCAFLAGAVVLAWSGPAGRLPWLLAATGLTWFVGGLDPGLVVLHRGPLVHLALAYPTGRLTGAARLVVPVGYTASVLPVLWGSGPSTVVLLVGLVLTAVTQVRAARGPLRRAKRQALLVTAGVGGLLIGSALVRAVLPQPATQAFTLLSYDVALIAVAGLVAHGVLRATWMRAPVTDLVLQLERRSGVVEDALARVLGDPDLRVGYWSGEDYVDAAGRPVHLPRPQDGRAATLVERRGRPLAVLVHDEAVLADATLLDAVGTAARLSEDNAGLQQAVARRLLDVEGSRRRLMAAGDDERARLVERLAEGAEQRLVALESCLARAARVATGSAVAEVERAHDELARTRGDLRALAAGLDPCRTAAGGLRGALQDLAARSSLPISVTAPDLALPPELASTVWFVCAEAVTNAVRHASASAARVQITVEPGRLLLTVTDDGTGGADMANGSGLRGLRDRVEALGGTLHVASGHGAGTVVRTLLPHPVHTPAGGPAARPGARVAAPADGRRSP